METSAQPGRGRKRTPQRAVPQSIRRSGKPLFFGWGAHLTHHEREQVKERVAAGIGILIALAVVAILANGWYQDNVAKPAAAAAARNRPVAIIGNTKVPHWWYEKVLHVQQTQLANQLRIYRQDLTNAEASKSAKAKAEVSQLQSLVQELTSQQGQLPSQIYTQLINNAVIAQRGPAAGLRFGPKAQKKYLDKFIKKAGGPTKFAITAHSEVPSLTVPQLKSLVLVQQRSTLMQAVLAKKVSKNQFEVHVRHILIGPATSEKKTLGAKKYATLVAKDHTLALKVQHELQSGTGTWKALALKYSQDAGSKKKGGDYGWVGSSTYNSYVAPYKNAALHQKIGVISIIHSQFGYHVFQVLGRGQRPMSKTAYSTAQQSALTNWLAKQEANKQFVQKLITPPSTALPTGLSSGLP